MPRRWMLVLACLAAAEAAAQSTYPSRPIRMIVPYPPGGGTDMIGRTLGESLAERLGQQVVVDNRGGASTMIGADIAARAPADGYTLLVATITTLATNPVTKLKLPYDPVRDFEPVSMLATQPYVLTAHPSVPAASVQQFVAYAKSNPGKLTVASPGLGSGSHLAAELLQHLAGIELRHVPYKGGGPAVSDLLGGHVSLTFAGVASVRTHVLGGRLRALAVTTARRSDAAPEIPTLAESGIAGYETNTWNSLVVPRGTPPSVISLLNAEIRASLGRTDVRDKLLKQGADPAPGAPAELASHIRSEIERFTKLVHAVGLKPQ